MAGKVVCVLLCVCAVSRTQVIPGKSRTNDGDYNSVNTDGSFDFGYKNEDVGSSYHIARGNANKVVGGRFGARDPATGTVKETVYTAGPRGFRAKGPNVHRKMDLDQRPRGPIGNKDDPYFDPNEDPSYEFKFNTRTYSKNENADARGDVKGHYSYVDDIGERHDVNYIAGRDTGFHVSSAHPDSPSVIGSLFHREPLRRGEAKQRGRTAIQRGLDGSYRFISAGPDQRRTESSDANGNVRGSYTFLDDKGVQRTVNYIAGPGIGYRIVKNSKDPYIPAYFPTIPTIYDPDFVNVASPSYSPDDVSADDVFKGPTGTAASGHVKPAPFPVGDKDRPGKKPGAGSASSEDDASEGGYSPTPGYGSSTSGGYGSGKPSSFGGAASDDDNFSPDEDASSYGGTDFDAKPTKPSGSRPNRPYRPWRPTTKPGKPTAKPGRPTTKPGRPTAKPGYSYGPTKKPYVPLKPFQKPSESVGGDYDTSDDDSKGPEYAVGFNIHSKPGETIIHKPDGTIIHKPGTTIIRNIGEDYFGIPPGVSVRAHVQSIDLYPYDSKPLSPAEALEKDKT